MASIDPLSLDFATRYPDAFARVLARGDAEESAELLESLPAEQKAAIAARLPAPRVAQLLTSDRHRPGDWLVDAPFDDAVNLLSRISRDRRLALLNALTDRKRQRQLLRHQQYPAHTIGALVRDTPMRINANSPAADVLAELREYEAEDPGPLVVVDGEGRYLGILDRWRLLIGDSPSGIARDYTIDVRSLHPEMPIAAVAMSTDWHTRNWLPVVDHRQRVLGGVSRARVFHAAGGPGNSMRTSNTVLDLLNDLVFVLATMLERFLSPRGHS